MASYEKNKNGTYSVRFRWVDADGREINKRLKTDATTKGVAEKEYIKFVALNPGGEKKENSIFKLTFLNVYHKYMDYKKNRLKESSLYDLENIFAKHILPYFEKKEIFKITKSDILNWQENFNQKKYSYKYKSKLRGCLFNFYTYCERYFDIPNIVRSCEPFVRPNVKKEIKIWTSEEFNKFINVVDNEVYKLLFIFLFYTGCRLGEALAISYKDFDLDKKIVNINKNLSEKSRNKNYFLTTPKNMSSYRNIDLPDILVNQLEIYIKLFPEAITNSFLFGQDNKPLPTTNLRRAYKYYLQLSDAPKIRIHDFRHSHASMLLSLGANILLISKRLGHGDTQITLNTYSHLMPNHESDIITKLNSF